MRRPTTIARILPVGVGMLMLAAVAAPLFAADGVITQVYMGTGDFDTSVGLSATKTYVSAVNIGAGATALTINGVSFAGANTANPTGTGFTTSGLPSTINSDQSAVTGQLGNLLDSFDYGGDTSTVTLNNLAAGQTYTLTFYNRQWDTGPARGQTATTTSGATFSFFESMSGGAVPSLNLLRYTFTATGTAETISFRLQSATFTFHNSGFSTEQVFNNAWVSGTNWTTATWGAAGVPNGVGSNAIFGAQASPTTMNLNAAQTVGNVRFSGTNAWTLAGSSALTLAADVGAYAVLSASNGVHEIAAPTTWSSNIFKTGTGTLVLSGSATTNGNALLLGSGVLSLASAGAIGSSGTISLGGGTLQFSAANTTDYSSRFDTSAGQAYAFDTNGQNVTFATALTSSSGALTKLGAGTLTLSAAATYSGTTNVNAGTLAVTGSALASAAVNVAGGATLAGGTATLNAVTIGNGGILTPGIAGAGTLTLSSLAFSGSATVNLGVRSGTAATRLQVNGGVTAAGGSNSVTFALGSGLASVVSGTYALISYTGSQLADTSAFTVSGTLGARQTVSIANGTQAVNLVSTNAFPIWSGTIDTGWSTADNWVLNTTGSATSFIAGDAVIFDDSAATGSVTLSQNVNPTSTTFSGTTLAYTLSSPGGFGITSGVLLKSGPATLTITASNSFADGTTLSAGTLRIGNTAALGTGGVTIAGGTITSDGATARTLANPFTLAANATFGNATDSGALTLSGTLDLGNTTRAVTIPSAVTLSGPVSNGSLTKLGSGTLTLSAANTFTGNTRVGAGVLALANASALQNSTLDMNASDAGSVTFAQDSTLGGLTGSRNLDMGGRTVSVGNNNQTTTFSGVLSNGTLAKVGTGSLTLSGMNSYSGGTVINGGTVISPLGANAGGTGPLGTASPANVVTINAGTLVGTSNNWLDNTALASNGLNAHTVVVNVGGTLKGASGCITGLGNVTLNGGTIEVSNGLVGSGWNGSFTLAGDITVSGSAVSRITTSSGAGASANIMMSNGANGSGGTRTFTVSDVTGNSQSDLVVSARLGFGTIVKSGAGILELTSGMAGTGTPVNWQVNAGTLLTTWTNAISTGSVTVAASGTLDLGGQSGVAVGGISLAGSLFNSATSAASTASNLNLAGATTAQIGGAGSLTLSGTLTNGGFTKFGSGTLTLSATNTFAGTTRVAAGVLTLSNAGALQSSTLDMNTSDSGTVTFGQDSTLGGLTGGRNLDMGGRTLSVGNNNQTLTYGGTLSNGAFTKIGTGTLTLSAASTYTGTTSVNAGTLAITSATFASQTVNVAGGAALSGTATLNAVTVANTGILTPGVGGFGTLTLSSLAFSGTGTVNVGVWSGTVSTRLQVNGGVTAAGGSNSVTFAFGGGLASLASGTYSLLSYTGLQLADASAFTVSGTLGPRQTVAIANGTQAVNLISANGLPIWNGSAGSGWSTADNWMLSTTGSATSFLAGDAVIFDDSASSGTVTLSQNVNPSTTTFSGTTLAYTLSSAGSFGITTGNLVKSGPASLTLSTSNSFPGGATLSAGTLRIGNDSALGTGGVTVTGGTITSDGATARTLANAFALGGNLTLGSATDTGGLTLSGTLDLGNATRMVTAPSGVTVSGPVINGGLVKAGSGTLTLSASNSYTGGTQLNGGVLALGNAGALGTTGTISFGGGALQFSGSNTTDYSARFSTATGQAYSLDTNGQTVTVATALTSSGGSLTKLGSGTLALSGSNSYTGPTTINAGVLQVGISGTGTSLTIPNFSFETPNSGNFTYTPSGAGWTFSSQAGIAQNTFFSTTPPAGAQAAFIQNSGSFSQSISTGTAGFYRITFQAQGRGGAAGPDPIMVQVDGVTSGSWAAGSISQSQWLSYSSTTVYLTAGSHTLAFLGTNTSGDLSTAIDNVWASQPTSQGTLASTSAVTLAASGATLDLNGTRQTIGSLAGVAGSSVTKGYLTAGGDGTSTTFAGSMSTATLTKVGTGTLTLTGSNAFLGDQPTAVAVNGGMIALGNAGALGPSGTISFGGGTLQFSASNATDYSSRFSTSTNQAYALDTNGQNVTLATALMSSGGSLTKLGNGTLALSGSNTYTGPTTISGGVLQIAISGTGTSLTIPNFSFETPNSGNFTYNPSGASWTFGGSPGAGSGIAQNTFFSTTPPAGIQAAFLQTTGSFFQTISAGTAGFYRVTFQAQGRGGASGPNGVIVQVNGTTAGTWAASDISQSQWLTYSSTTVYLTAGSHTLAFLGNNTLGGDRSTSIDNVWASQPTSQGVLPSTSAVTLGASGAGLDLNGTQQTIASLSGVPGSSVMKGYLTAGGDGTSTTFAGSMSTMTLTKVGSGTLTLTGSNSFLPDQPTALALNGGMLALGSSGALGTSGTLFFGSGTLQFSASNTTDYSNRFSTAAGQAYLLDTNGQNVTLAAALASSGGSLTKLGSGTLTLSAANSYTGATTISAGALQIGSGGATGSIADTGPVSVASGATLVFNRSGGLTYGGTVSGAGGLTKLGSGVLTLSAASTYTGTTNVEAGTLAVNAASLASSTINVAGGAALSGTATLGAVTVADAGILTPGVVGVGTLTLSSLAFSGSATVNMGVQNFAPASLLQVNGGVTTAGGSNPITFAFGSGLASLNTGTYTLLSYTGPQLGDASAFAVSGTAGARQAVSIANGTQAVNLVVGNAFPIWSGTAGGGWSTTDNWVLDTNGAPTSFLANDATVFDDSAATGAVTLSQNVNPASATFSGTTLAYTLSSAGGFGITTGALVKNGAATLTISTSNSYAGGTTLSAGTLRIGNNAALGTGAVTVTGGMISSDGASARTLANAFVLGGDVTLGSATDSGALALSGTVDLGAATRTLTNPSNVTLSGAVINGGLAKSGSGTLTLSGSNTYTGGTQVNAGVLALGNAAALGPSGAISFGGGTLQFSGSNTSDYSARFSAAAGQAYRLDTNGQNITLASGLTSVGGSLVKLGSGTLTLTGANTFTGTTTVSAGVLQVGAGGATGSLASAEANVAGGLTLVFNRTGSVAYGGVVSGAGGLTNIAAGTLTLSGASTYTGVTTFAAGVVEVSALTNYGVAGPLGGRTSGQDVATNIGLLFRGGTLRYAGSTAQSTNRAIRVSTTGGATIDASGSVPEATMSFTATSSPDFFENGGTRTLTLTGSNTGANTFAMQIAEAGGATSLVKSGLGRWVLTGANTFTGATTISGGTLQIGAGGTSGSLSASTAITNNAALAFNRSDAVTVANTISGTGVVVQQGTGNFTLTGANTHSGGTRIAASSGTFTINNVSALGTGRLTLDSGTLDTAGISTGYGTVSLVNAAANPQTWNASVTYAGTTLPTNLGSGTVTLTGNRTVTVPTNTFAVGGFTGGFTIEKAGTGTLVLQGAGSQAGTTVSAGTLRAEAAGALGTGAVTVATGATLALGSLNQSAGGLAGAGSVVGWMPGVTTPQDGASLVNASKTYIQLLDFGDGTAATINGVAFNTAGTSGSGFTLAGATTIYPQAGSPTGYAQLMSDFYYGGNPGTLTFTGLTAGTAYEAVLYTQIGAWNNRVQNATFTNGTDVQTLSNVDEGAVGAFVYGFVAQGGTASIRMAPTGAATFHWFAASLQQVGAPTLTVGDAGDYDFSGIISGRAGLTKTGAGTQTLSGVNTYSGATTISGGTLALSGAGDISSAAGVSIASGATLDISAASGTRTINSLSDAGNVRLGGNTLRTVIPADGAQFGGVISGSGGFTKAGEGRLELTNVQAFTGAATVEAGSLLLNGSVFTSAARIFVADGASIETYNGALAIVDKQTLGGYGTVYGAVSFASGGILSPGGSVGTLTNDGSSTWNAGTLYQFELNDANGLTPGVSPGWDLYNVTGDLTLAGSAGNPITIDLTSLAGADPGLAANFNPNFNYAWKFVVAGTEITTFNASWFTVDSSGFQNLPGSPERFYVARGDQMSQINATGGANELYVVYAAIPEPSTVVLAGIGLAVVALAARRRRHAVSDE